VVVMMVRWKQLLLGLGLALALTGLGAAADAASGPPPQKLPSALLMFPYIDSGGGRDTRIELVNLSGFPLELQCFFVNAESVQCNEIGFFLALTPYQPVAWLASEGVSNELNSTAAPPFFGVGELKCAVVPPQPNVDLYNALQGRATVYDSDGKTVSYSSVAFRRFSDGEFTGLLQLNGSEYAQCPDKLHFDVLTDTPTSTSELILLPCTQDLLLQSFEELTVQFLIINEFEQTFSTSYGIRCFSRKTLSEVADSLTRAVAGSDTAHVVIRGVRGPLIGLVIDSVPYQSMNGTAGNEPSFQGGRSATVTFPRPQ
jgi:hypothetical protein